MPNARKSIFITGAASGIGRETALLFSERGWFCGLYDVNAEGLAETAAKIPEAQRVSGVLDVRDASAWKAALADFAQASGGALDVLFNNAGIGRHGWFEEIAEADANAIIDINLKGVVNGVYAALPWLKQSKGRIINTSSASSLYGAPRLAAYSATKFAVRGLTEALDIELARHGVRAVCLIPWFIETPILDMASSSGGVMRDELKFKIYPVRMAAEGAWKAAHTHDVHVIVGKDAAELSFAARLAPGIVRRKLKKMLSV
ncbi:MAG: SDR family oxidoreductase [Hyphomonadaceae bacterium]